MAVMGFDALGMGEVAGGGGLSDACARFGGAPEEWLDLSHTVNPVGYPIRKLSAEAFAHAPDRGLIAALEETARAAYGVPEAAEVVAAAGVSALIRAIPRLTAPGGVWLARASYGDHRRSFLDAGWSLSDGGALDAAVVVTPGATDGRLTNDEEIEDLAREAGLLIIDETFQDITPERSRAAAAGEEGVIVLRSVSKFYGLAGLRLGFAVTGPETAARLRAALGPWPVSGPAVEIGRTALLDAAWAAKTRARLRRDCGRLAAMGAARGWRLVGEAGLFATFETEDAADAQAHLAWSRVWSRIFPYSRTWLRLSPPGREGDWRRLDKALRR